MTGRWRTTSGWRAGAAFVVLASSVVVAACSDDDVDLGGGTTTATSVSGTWTGYIEQYVTPLGSDAVRLQLVVDGSRVTGTFDVGNAAPPPPPTDPERPPFGDLWEPATSGAADPRQLGAVLPDGYRYPLLDGTMTDGRIRAGFRPDDTLSTWCGLQKPYDWYTGTSRGPDYQCARYGEFVLDAYPWVLYRAADGTEFQVHTFKRTACFPLSPGGPWGRCVCTSAGCTVPVPGVLQGNSIRLDLSVSGDTMSGSIGVGDKVRYLRLTRQRP